MYRVKLGDKLMDFLKRQKISIKITLLYTALFSAILFLLSAMMLFMVRYYIHNSSRDILIKSKEEILININDYEKLKEISMNNNLNIDFFDNNDNKIDRISNTSLNYLNNNAFNKYIYMDEKDQHFIYTNFYYDNGYIQLTKSINTEYFYLKALFVVLCIIDFLGVLISILVGFWFGKKLLKRIDNITVAAQNISISNLDERIEISDVDDELSNLAKTFNDMIDRLQQALERKLQFVSDASHELRTPITIIQGYANLIQRWGKDDREALEKSIDGIKLEADGMAKLVENLLLLAKSDDGIIKPRFQELDLKDIVSETINESSILNESFVFKWNENSAGIVKADYNMVKQILRIFIENSIRYSEDSNEVQISSYIKNNINYIEVKDFGMGIPKKELPHIFDRFYRVEKSRSKEMGGTGLGLSIATLLCKMNNIDIEVKSEEGKGTSMILKF